MIKIIVIEPVITQLGLWHRDRERVLQMISGHLKITDLEDTLKTLKTYGNEVSYTINIENVWYINSCSANRSILGGFSSLFWEEILSKIFEWNSKIYFSDKHLTDLIAHVWYNFVKSLLHSLPLIKLLDKTIYRVREAFIQT